MSSTSFKAGLYQRHDVDHSMNVLEHYSFLRAESGLCQLESIKEFAKILEIPMNQFNFDVRREPINGQCKSYNYFEIIRTFSVLSE